MRTFILLSADNTLNFIVKHPANARIYETAPLH